MKLLRPLPLALALATLFAGSVQAQNLVQMYEAARGYDAGYQSARAQYDASIARADQANALILPTVNAAAGYSQTQFENKTGNNIVIDTSFGTENASISASQPLYRPANLAGYEQGRKQVDIAKAQLDAIEQDLIVRVSTAYFDVLSAQDNLFLIREQKKAVAEQLASAKRNFEVGTATITDTREAEARYDLILASEIGAENDLRVKRLALEVVVGKAANDPKPLARPVTLPAIPLTDDAFWINQAVVNNPTLRQARLGVDVAKLETEKAYAGHKPTLDLTASYGNTRYPGGNASSGFYTRTTSGTLGLALNIPLFAGFAVENRVKETLSSAACGEVEGVRPHQQRAAAGGGLDQVLPAQRREAAAQQRHVGQRVVQRHLAQGVADPGVGAARRWRRAVGPKARAAQHLGRSGRASAATSSKRCGWRGTISSSSGRAAGQRRARPAAAAPPRLRASWPSAPPGAASACAPGAATRQQRGRRASVELQVAGTCTARARGAQPRGIGLGLRQRARQAGQRRPQQRRSAGPWPGSSRTGGHWPAPSARRRSRVASSRLGQISVSISTPTAAGGAQEAPHGARRVVGQPGLHVARLQQRAAGFAAGGGAVGQQQRTPGTWAQRVDQGLGGARLAQRHGMDPHPAGPGRPSNRPRRSFQAARYSGSARRATTAAPK
jgi:outer membrane protein